MMPKITTYEVHPVDGLWEVRISGGNGQIELAVSKEAAVWRARHLVLGRGGGRVLIRDEKGDVARELLVEEESPSSSPGSR